MKKLLNIYTDYLINYFYHNAIKGNQTTNYLAIFIIIINNNKIHAIV